MTMNKLILLILCLAMNTSMACENTLLDKKVRRLASDEEVNICELYEGNVILVVNTASECGNTPQYDGLEALYEKYADKGFVVLGFPSNDFFGQEPGTEEEIQDFCRLTYGVQFPMFGKTSVKKGRANSFFKALADASGTYPKWNFHKYLIGRDGKYISEFSPRTKPDNTRLVNSIEKALKE